MKILHELLLVDEAFVRGFDVSDVAAIIRGAIHEVNRDNRGYEDGHVGEAHFIEDFGVTVAIPGRNLVQVGRVVVGSWLLERV